MTPMEYADAKRKIEEEARIKINALSAEYAKKNNPYTIGDIIESDWGIRIIIDKIKYTHSQYSDPCPQNVYIGRVLKKDGTTRADGKVEYVLQTRIVAKK